MAAMKYILPALASLIFMVACTHEPPAIAPTPFQPSKSQVLGFDSGRSHPVILSASGLPLIPSTGIALLHNLGKQGALEESTTALGLSFRPWDGRNFQDYQWIYEPDTPLSFRLHAPEAKEGGRAVVSLWDWSGNLVFTKTYTGFPVDDCLTFQAKCHGVWLVTFDAYTSASATSLQSRLIKSFGTTVDAASARALWHKKNDYFIGSCFFPQRYYRWGKKWAFENPPFAHLSASEGIDRLADLAARAGITVLRVEDFVYDPERQKEVLDILQRHGIQEDLKVHLPSDCFLGKSLDLNPDTFGLWDREMDSLIDRMLKPNETGVALVELGNEPAHHEFWGGERAQYQWLVQCLRKKIHAVNPSMPVLLGGSCPPGADLDGEKLKNPVAYKNKKEAQENWYRGFYRDMAPTEALWAYHQHSDLDSDAVAWREWERMELSKNGFHGAFLQTEGGTCAWRPDREVTTWPSVLQKILYSWSRGEKGWMQYDLAQETIPSRYKDSEGWAMIHAHDFTPKFQYGALAAMTKTLAGCMLEKTLCWKEEKNTTSLAVLFKHPEGKMVAWFGPVGQTGLEIRSDARQWTHFDSMGNVVERGQGGRAALLFQPGIHYTLLKTASWVQTASESK